MWKESPHLIQELEGPQERQQLEFHLGEDLHMCKGISGCRCGISKAAQSTGTVWRIAKSPVRLDHREYEGKYRGRICKGRIHSISLLPMEFLGWASSLFPGYKSKKSLFPLREPMAEKKASAHHRDLCWVNDATRGPSEQMKKGIILPMLCKMVCIVFNYLDSRKPLSSGVRPLVQSLPHP